jgi:hypothetical protein
MMGYGVIKRYGFSLFCLYTAIVLGLARLVAAPP